MLIVGQQSTFVRLLLLIREDPRGGAGGPCGAALRADVGGL